MLGHLLSPMTWFGIYTVYVFAAALIVGGVYLFLRFPASLLFRLIGTALVIVGVIMGAVDYGKSLGAAECEQRWTEKKLDAQIDQLKQEAAAKAIAAETAAQQAKQIADANNENLGKLSDYREAIGKLASSLSDCRRASADDDRRMCNILGPTAKGCGDPRGLRPKR